MEIKLKKLNDCAKVPSRGTEYSAGYDLHACIGETEVYTIRSHTTVKVKTGIAIEIPDGFFGAIFARSGIAVKNGLRPANCVGVIDSDYRGEIVVALHNDTDVTQYCKNGDRVAQLVILPYEFVKFSVVDSLNETVRGNKGFGSTGVNTIVETHDLNY